MQSKAFANKAAPMWFPDNTSHLLHESPAMTHEKIRFWVSVFTSKKGQLVAK
jgi:hypothetical protein